MATTPTAPADVTTLTIPDTDYGRVWHLTVPTDTVASVLAVAPRVPFGPDHNRGVLDYLNSAAHSTRTGDLDAARRWIAEAVAWNLKRPIQS